MIMNDVDLAGGASRRPGTLAELATCRGMGPIRLERYGDEILASTREPDPRRPELGDFPDVSLNFGSSASSNETSGGAAVGGRHSRAGQLSEAETQPSKHSS